MRVWAAALSIAALSISTSAQTPASTPVRLNPWEKTLVRTSGQLPVYPPDMAQQQVGGVVSLDLEIDAAGKVTGAKVAKSPLAAASVAAARTWTYRPPVALVEGKPAPALLEVMLYFDGKAQRVDEVHRIDPQGPSPKRTKTAPPVSPAGRSGQAVLDLVVDRFGAVVNVQSVRVASGLETAARNCVNQWAYEPLLINGQAVPFVVTVTLLFPGKIS